MKNITLRKRFFLAVEGQGEQAFIRWLQELSDQNQLQIHLDCEPLGGGGYYSMLEKAKKLRKRKDRNKVTSILIIDSDRAEFVDKWSLAELKQAAFRDNFEVCIQRPNQEGLFLRMLLPSEKKLQLNASQVKEQLIRCWPNYRKPVDSRTLASKFTLDDLCRVAKTDEELRALLINIGFGAIIGDRP